MVGNARGDGGTRGWVAGVDFETGQEIWRWYAVPAPDEPGGETWADDHEAWRTGGGAIWTGWSFDVEANAFVGGTAQPVPMFDPEFRPGDNLYTNSAVSLDAATGQLNWYFQYVPNESWDYDEQGVHMIINADFGNDVNPRMDRKMVVHFGRNGYFYHLDGNDGRFLNAEQYVTQVTWTAGIDPETGLPVEYDPNLTLQTYIPETRWSRADTEPKTACPMLAGGTRWQPPAYNPDTGMAFVGGEDGCQTHMIMPALTLEDGGIDEQGRRVPGSRADTPLGGLVASVNVNTGDLGERIITPYRNKSGILATSGRILFTAYEDGTVAALNDETLEELWRFNTGIGIKAPPIAYAVDGKMYVAIVAGAIQEQHETIPERGEGSMLFVFAL
jgi:alcohol dehydrogenase (cytochrome c)